LDVFRKIREGIEVWFCHVRFDFLGKIGEFSRKDGKVAFGLKLGFCGGTRGK
jgi:hypothetical protein